MSSMRIDTIDLRFQGTPHVIAAFLLHGPEGPVLIECGPTSTLPSLTLGLDRFGLLPTDVRHVLLTHIHFDHAGAAGWWARQGATIYVHPNGAPHLIDPSKLIASATRIYGERMDTLWGEILPAPAERVVAIEDGTLIRACGLEITAIETPGHARHHLVYQLDDVVFTGDAAGIMLPGNRWVDLPAPPPEFDLEAWKATLDRLRAMNPRTLYRTHYDSGADAAAELDRLERLLDNAVSWVADGLERGLDRDASLREFTAKMREAASLDGLDPDDMLAYELANPREMSVDGILRYLKKRR